MKALHALNRLDIPELCTLATAIIDYRGYRLVAQSIVPGNINNNKTHTHSLFFFSIGFNTIFLGILQRENPANVLYGSVDNGKKINVNEEFHQLLLKASDALFIKEHTVIDEDKTHVKLVSSPEVKGLVGSDGRKYFLDFVRVAPRDANFPGKENSFVLLRPELMAIYNDYLLKEEQRKRQHEKRKDKKTTKVGPSNETEEAEEGEEESETAEQIPYPLIKFNVNVFTNITLGGSPEEIKKDEDDVLVLSKFLVEKMIPSLVKKKKTNF